MISMKRVNLMNELEEIVTVNKNGTLDNQKVIEKTASKSLYVESESRVDFKKLTRLPLCI